MLTGVVALPYLHNTGAAIFVASLLSGVITIIIQSLQACCKCGLMAQCTSLLSSGSDEQEVPRKNGSSHSNDSTDTKGRMEGKLECMLKACRAMKAAKKLLV